MTKVSLRAWYEEQKEFLEIVAGLYLYTMKKIFLLPYHQCKEILNILKSEFKKDNK